MKRVIVIGSGVAGMTAARMLSEKAIAVTVLEARGRTGGRIFTSREKNFSFPVDCGAEFIHGRAPLMRSLAKEAGGKLREGNGRMWYVHEGNAREEGPFDEDWGKFMSLLNTLEVDMPIGEFIETRFKGETFTGLRESVTRFVEGFDAADMTKASAFSLREEWSSSEDAITGVHVEGGLSTLTDFLYGTCSKQGVDFHFGTIATVIRLVNGKVQVQTKSGAVFTGDSCIVTIPPSVLKQRQLKFEPTPDDHMNALEKLELGGVIKFLFEFNDMVWDNSSAFRQFPDMHFIFSDAVVPTWWSQHPSHVPLLTGWLSGPITKGMGENEENLMAYAVQSLAYIFNVTAEAVLEKVKASKVINWQEDQFSMGAYAYRTVDTASALNVISKPINDCIYFAGEAYYGGGEMGTVEAAIASGRETAMKLTR